MLQERRLKQDYAADEDEFIDLWESSQVDVPKLMMLKRRGRDVLAHVLRAGRRCGYSVSTGRDGQASNRVGRSGLAWHTQSDHLEWLWLTALVGDLDPPNLDLTPLQALQVLRRYREFKELETKHTGAPSFVFSRTRTKR